MLPLSGWYLAQARPDLTAKDPTQYEIGATGGIRTQQSIVSGAPS